MKASIQPIALFLFAIYLLSYCGFVFITAFFPQMMQRMAIGNVNVAVVYGIGLILAAFLLAMVYELGVPQRKNNHVLKDDAKNEN